MAENLVFYPGVEVNPDWPARIQGARAETAYEIDPPRGEDPAS